MAYASPVALPVDWLTYRAAKGNQGNEHDPEGLNVMEALTRASKRGDRDATELLVFGDLEELSEKSPAAPE